ncbi:hypothetical protein LCGC14_1199050 [marine sediment metagenome]|uniref:HPr kinase/phosphorylase C-terminal domain-containing protein n=1 Tax=marine sediment metagenome TaxID=412755 RepID=A0A0F9M4U7_9ZZZZ
MNARTPYRYRAFGLVIDSDFNLGAPILEAEGPADLSIFRARLEHQPTKPVEMRDGVCWMHWPEIGTFAIEGPDRIAVDPAPGVSDALVALPLTGSVMAMLMVLQRGALVLHASAVGLGGRSLVLLGDKTAGKSTTAARFVAAGHPLLSDDVVALSFAEGGAAAVVPALGQMKLSAEAAASLTFDSQVTGSGEIHPAILKEQHALRPQDLLTEAQPPLAFCVLDRGSKAALTPLPRDEALTQLLRFSHPGPYGSGLLSQAAIGRHLTQCAALAGRYTVARLEVPDGLARLSEVVALMKARAAASG